MSYYILPKIQNLIDVNPTDTINKLNPIICFSFYNYYNEIINQIKIYSNENELSYIIALVNPYEYIFSKVSGSQFSVSKLKLKTNIFYDFFEISTTLSIFETYKSHSLNSLHLTSNNNDTIECFKIFRENFNDIILCYDEINDNVIRSIEKTKFDLLFFETRYDNNEYIISLLEITMIILKNQKNGGNCIIKINDIFYKPIIDILYLLSSLYNKIYIFKPNTSNITSFEKYVVCKDFDEGNDQNKKKLSLNYFKLSLFLQSLKNKKEIKTIKSILDLDISYYFLKTLTDINITIGEQQIESLNFVLNLLKNKNRDEKIESLKKINIQKSVAWCEKYKIPCNKFSERTNIFLPLNKDSIES